MVSNNALAENSQQMCIGQFTRRRRQRQHNSTNSAARSSRRRRCRSSTRNSSYSTNHTIQMMHKSSYHSENLPRIQMRWRFLVGPKQTGKYDTIDQIEQLSLGCYALMDFRVCRLRTEYLLLNLIPLVLRSDTFTFTHTNSLFLVERV